MHKIPALFKKLWGAQTSSWRVLIPGILLTVILLLLPTGYEGALIYQDAEKVRATVLEVLRSPEGQELLAQAVRRQLKGMN